MADKHFSDQFDDEEVLLVFRKHPVVMRRSFIVAMLAPLVGTLPSMYYQTVSSYFVGLGCGLLAGAIILLPAWISWYFSVFIVTDQRLIQITQKGLFHRSVIDMRLGQIQMVNYQIAGLQQTLLGFGTIMMQTYVGDLVIHDVHRPAVIQKKLLEILRAGGVETIPAPVVIEAEQTVQEDEA